MQVLEPKFRGSNPETKLFILKIFTILNFVDFLLSLLDCDSFRYLHALSL